jgi:hypothetical protein
VTEQPHGSYGPSGSGSVVLDLGPGTGALVLRTPPELDGQEIEISACERPGRRTHALVRPRHTASGTSYAAVYPGLAAGDYLVWREAATAALTVAVAGGQVSVAEL